MTSELLFLYSLFIPALLIAIFAIKKMNDRRAPKIAELLKTHAIPTGTNGYASGKTVFSSHYVFLTKNELIGLDANTPNTAIRLKYRDIETIRLHGWLLMKLTLRTKSGQKLNVAPINRIGSEGGQLLIYPDTSGEYYLKYMGLFHHFVKALEEKGVKKNITSSIRWKFGNVRRVISSFFVAFLILASIIVGVIWTTGA